LILLLDFIMMEILVSMQICYYCCSLVDLKMLCSWTILLRIVCLLTCVLFTTKFIIKLFLFQAFTMTVMWEFGIRMIKRVNSMSGVTKATTVRQLGTRSLKVWRSQKVTVVKR
jgi:hypothetical protein